MARLDLTRTELRAEIGKYLGYGTDSANWSTSQGDDIDRALQSGLRLFYQHPSVNGVAHHEWSFLSPEGSLKTIAGQDTYALPDDFGSIQGRFYYPENNYYGPIEERGWGQIRALKESTTGNGRMQVFAISPIRADGAQAQRWQVIFWPTPDGEYALPYRYRVLPEALDANRPFPYGGGLHAETIKAACIAAAALDNDDEKAMRWDHFMQMLGTSVEMDLAQSAPSSLGYNGDAQPGELVRRGISYVTYNGVRY